MTTSIAQEVIAVNIEDELKQSYLDYAMSVIVGRALPDVRDGLKPVHRRILFAMLELNNDHNKPYKKSARIVGDVIGKYHPHGDTAVYDAIVRMAQPFSLRYLLVDGQGNFGSVDGDAPAAMRYTEIRMTALAQALLMDLGKETVDFAPNYDGSELIPVVLPAQIPNLLVNGSSGIAVGMATNIPPHNLDEVVNACIALIDKPAISIDELMQHLKGPDFPTAGIIYGRAGIVDAYRSGRGRVYVRAKTKIESAKENHRDIIVVTELPYQVNKARLMEKIAQLVKDKKIEGIVELRDESDKDGIRMVIELSRGTNPQIVLNNLYANTQLQITFGINMVALVDNQPRILNLKQILQAFILHRRDVVTRRLCFELRRAKKRAHILEGLSVALANVDAIVLLIKSSKTPAIAKERLLLTTWQAKTLTKLLATKQMLTTTDDYGLKDDGYRLSPPQVQAILDLKLQRLTGLEQEKIYVEYQELSKLIIEISATLADDQLLMTVIRQELSASREQFADKRRTEIIAKDDDINIEDLIAKKDIVVTLSHCGYIKAQTLDSYQAQRRGGRGKVATKMKEEDFVEKLIIAHSHDTILCFSTRGRLYWLKAYHIPQASRQSRGLPIVNLLPLAKGERINTILAVRALNKDHYIFMATVKGIVKKVSLAQFSNPRTGGIIALTLALDDELVAANITDGHRDVMLFTTAGKAIRFNETAIRSMGRSARGVCGITLENNHRVVALVVVNDQSSVLVASINGYGKRIAMRHFRKQSRGGKGILAMQVSGRNGELIAAKQVIDHEEIMLISNQGTLIRTRISEISVMSRYAKGVRLISLVLGEKLVGIASVAKLAVDSECVD